MIKESIVGTAAFARDKQMLHSLQWFEYNSKLAFLSSPGFHIFSSDSLL